MQQSKKILEGVISGIFVFGIFYFLSAFVNAEFDFTKWEQSARAFVGVMGGTVACIVGFLVAKFNNY